MVSCPSLLQIVTEREVPVLHSPGKPRCSGLSHSPACGCSLWGQLLISYEVMTESPGSPFVISEIEKLMQLSSRLFYRYRDVADEDLICGAINTVLDIL